jgi:hypothetical protein
MPCEPDFASQQDESQLSRDLSSDDAAAAAEVYAARI